MNQNAFSIENKRMEDRKREREGQRVRDKIRNVFFSKKCKKMFDSYFRKEFKCTIVKNCK